VTRRIIVGISGSTGAIYGARLLEVLHGLADIESHLVMSSAARTTIEYEMERDPDEVAALADVVYDERSVGAAIASGSFVTDGMIVAPCSMRSLSAIANSLNDTLLTRAADVCLKERRRLVLLARETPLHAGHLRLMLECTNAGAVILPPSPAFYHRPQNILDIVDQTLGKALDQFGIDAGLFTRWQGLEKS
jgi:flavin prenyltransferase